MNPNSSTSPPHRKSHRKRVSALRLSSDTTPSLPEYHPDLPPTTWLSDLGDLPSDRPPDYSDSAEEADADTSDNDDARTIYVPPQSPASSSPRSPRRLKRHTPSHKRKQSSPTSTNDPYLDSLLARSVHALEMSNTLLQSSISTQTSLTTILGSGNDTAAEQTLEARAQVLSSRIRQWDAEQPSWMGDLEEISKGVDVLFGSPEASTSSAVGRNRKISSGSLSSSLPTSSSPLATRRHGKRPSLDLKQASETAIPRIKLNLAPQTRPNLVSPPPRALTQYVVAGHDEDSDEDDILLPSTLGLRVSSSMHSIPRSPHIAHPHSRNTHVHNPVSVPELASLSTPNLSLHAAPSLPILTDRPVEPSTPAYNMLSSFVVRKSNSGTSTPLASSFTSSFMRPRKGRGSSNGSTERGQIPQNQTRRSVSPERMKSGVRQSRSQTPRREFSPLLERRTVTPPLEESSSSDSCVGKQTILSLRKILDEQPSPQKPPTKALKAPSFHPRTPASIAEANTSTTTASISRLLTKGKHTSSTRPPSPPRQSAMKRSSPAVTPVDTAPPTATSSVFPDLLGVSRVLGASKSNTPSSSGLSTPKRISFAELPESYASTRPEGAPSKFKEKKRRKKGSAGKGKALDKDSSDESGWWSWFGVTGSMARHEERMEDRMSRAWSGRMSAGMGGSVDEWAI